jgi:hypothetical protein
MHGMDNNIDFDSVSQELGLFLEGQNALEAAQPDCSCELLYAGFIPSSYTQSTVNCDW